MGRRPIEVDGDSLHMVAFPETTEHDDAFLRLLSDASVVPSHHRDPFDRLLVAQAMTEPLVLITADAMLLPYSELVRLV